MFTKRYGDLKFSLPSNSNEKLKEKDIFQVMFERATIGILIVKNDGEIVMANAFAEKLFGYNTAELNGQKVEILIPDALRSTHVQHRNNYHKKPVERTMGDGLNLFGKRKDGTTFSIEISLGHTEFEGKKLAIAYVNDVSRQKAAEIAIKKEKTTAQMYLDIAGSLIVVIDKNEQVTLLNQRGAEILGVSEAAAIGKNWFDNFIPTEERKATRDIFDRLMDKKEKNVEYYSNNILNKNGEKRLIWWHNRVLFDESGEAQGTISSGVDITEQHKAQTMNEDISNIVEESLNEIFIFDAKSLRFLLVNKGGRQNVGYTQQELNLLTPLDIKPEYSKRKFLKLIKPLLRKEQEKIIFETIHQRKDQSTYPVEIHLQYASLENQPVFVAIISDISERKESEQKILEYSQQLEQKVKERTAELEESQLKLTEALTAEKELGQLKSRFVSMASHEFRTPLSSILSSAELIQMYIDAGKLDKVSRSTSRIKSSVRNLTGILNDFLSLEKLEAGKLEVTKEKVALADFLEDLKEEIKPILRINQQFIYTHETKTVETDAYLLKNILINLISNAIKYSPKGEDVRLSVQEENSHIVFKVIDQGIGIPDEDKIHMFTRFFRASNVENIKGTGLGLTIVKRYLDLINGTIDFESTYGKGSTFMVRLPLN